MVITPFYTDAEQVAFVRGFYDWRWFPSAGIALDWIDRCAERGVEINATFVYPSKRRDE